MENTTDEVANHVKSPRIRRIHECVRKVKTSEGAGVKYMQAWEEKYFDIELGGKNKLKEQIKKKVAKGKTVAEIADALEESEEVILELMKEMEETE